MHARVKKIADCDSERRALFKQFGFLKYMDAQGIRQIVRKADDQQAGNDG